MRVLHVITGLASGGAETQLRSMLAHTGTTPEVITLTNAGAIANDIRAAGIPVTDLGMDANPDLSALPRLVELIKAGRYDVVHTHLYRALLFGRLAARRAGVPTIVATEHSLGQHLIEGRSAHQPGVRMLYRAAERLGHATIAVSPTVETYLRDWDIPQERIRVIPNGIDADAFRPVPGARERVRAKWGIPNDARVVGYVGRLVAPKHVPLLLTAVEQLPGTRLLLVGDGAEAEELRALSIELGMADRVTFTGETGQVKDLYAAMDVHVNPSPAETFGLATLESLAAGLPSVYVSCPALDDLPDHHVGSARRVTPDSVALRNAISELLAGSHPAATLPEHYDIARTCAQVDELYTQLHLNRPLPTEPDSPA